MISINKVIQLNESLLAGAGKLSIRSEDNGESNVAVVHQNTVEVLLLDKEGKVIKQESFKLNNLFHNQLTEIHVLWSTARNDPFLVVLQCNQLFKLVNNSRDWTVTKEILLGHDASTLTNTSVTDSHSIYTGTNHGLWEIGNNFEYQCQLTITSTVAVSVSAQWLAVALESGEIALFKGGPQRWTQHSQIPTLKGLKDLDYCYTSLLIHDKPQEVVIAARSTGSVCLFSLPGLDLLAEVAAHIRWISQLLPCSGGFLSGSEDSFVHLWRLDTNEIRYVDSLQLENSIILSGAAINDAGNYLFTVYDRPQMYQVTVLPFSAD